jgi:integrase
MDEKPQKHGWGNETGYRTGEHALTKDELKLLLGVCDDLEDEVMIKVGVSLGLRREDIANLRIQDINTTDGTLIYSEKKKGGRSRLVYLEPDLNNLLKKYIKILPKDQKLLFKIKGRQMFNRYNDLLAKAKLGNRPFHSLRATCAKILLYERGWSILQVANLLGDSVRTIEWHYVVPSTGEMKELSQRKGALSSME